MDSLFSWLHISDIHFGHGNVSQSWDQRLVTSELRLDIAKAQKAGYPHPDVVLLTGDVAFSGGVRNRAGSSQAAEYGEARDWLNGLMQDLGLSPELVFVIPGNHDIQRNVDEDRNVHRLVNDLREGRDLLDSVWAYPDDEILLARRQANYLDFASGFGAKTPRLFWMEQVKARMGLTVRLVGLNSSLLCANDEDQGKLDIGNEQLGLTLLRPPIEPAELVVALTHHPFDWLRGTATAVQIIQRYAHIHLCGHIHQADSTLISTGGGMHLVHVVAGAVHDLATPKGAPLRYGYSFGSIHAAPDGAITLRVWPRAWSFKNQEFRIDVDNVPDGENSASHLLRFRMPPSPVLPQHAVTVQETGNLGAAAAAFQSTSSYFAPLYEASKAVLAQFGLERRQILEQIILPAMSAIVGHRGASTLLGMIQLYDGERGALILDSVYSSDQHQQLARRIGEVRPLGAGLARGERIGVTGRTVLSARSQLVFDVEKDADYIEFVASTRSELAVPLFGSDPGTVIGVLNVESDRLNAFDEEDLKALETFADLVGVAIQNARQVEALRTRTTLAFMGLQNAVSRHEQAGQMGILLTKLQRLEASLAGDSSSRQMTSALLTDIERSTQGFTLDWPKEQAQEGLRSILVNEELIAPFQRRFVETHPEWRQRLTAFFDLDSSVRIQVHVDWLFRVLDILVDNAAQAAAQNIALGSRLSRRQGWVEIVVSDDGKGLPPEVRDRLFREPIRQGSKGLGTGLLIAQEIIRIYGGHISWEDRTPQGTTLVLSFPAEMSAVMPPTIPRERRPDDGKPAARVLLADNEPAQLEAWSEVLRGAGYEVIPASSVSEALEHLIKGGLDLAVLDLNMQEEEDESNESGLRLAQIFRESVPIILLTGKATISAAAAALQREGRSSPAVAFVRKQQDGPRVLLQEARRAIVPKVFVFHGRDENARTSLIKFLENSGAHAVVLEEQSQMSRMVDAFEEYANVQFAIILITPDEEGRLRGDAFLRPRSRQSAIFELGFLLAKLGRNRVVALSPQQEEPLEVPSNLQGVLYLELDAQGEWQDKLRSAMSAVGIHLH